MLTPSDAALAAADEFFGTSHPRELAAQARRMIALDPYFGEAYEALAVVAMHNKRLAEAEEWLREGLAKQPCTYLFYWHLVSVQERNDDEVEDLQELVCRKLSACLTIPKDIAKVFNKTAGRNLGLNFRQPESFELVVQALREKRGSDPNCAHLRPYFLFDHVQEQAETGLDEALLDQLRAMEEEVQPILWAALNEWARNAEALSPVAICLVIALLGEMGAPGALEDLLEATTLTEGSAFLHAHWAVFRMGQRFPEFTLRKFAELLPGATTSLRCTIAEQLRLMPPQPLATAAARLLLDGIPPLEDDENTAYLVLAARHTMRVHGLDAEAAHVQSEADGHYEPRLQQEEITGFTIEDLCLSHALYDAEDLDFDDEEMEDIEDEEADFELQPPPPPTRPGRNDPCWCGSGVKYKKCHLSQDEQTPLSAAAAPALAKTETGRLFDDVMDAAVRWDPSGKYRLASLETFFGSAHPPDDHLGHNLYAKWFICDFRPRPDAPTIVERYLREKGPRLTPSARVILEAWRDSHFSVYEVQRVEPGTGFDAKDLFGPGEFFIHDRTSSRSTVQWDCCLVRLEFLDGKWTLGENGILVPRSILDLLQEKVGRESAASGLEPGAWVRSHVHLVQRWIPELSDEQNSKRVVLNGDGDPIEFGKANYQILDGRAALDGLEKCPEFRREEDDGSAVSFSWSAPARGREPRQSYGNISVRRGRLTLDCNSRRRLTRGRELIETFAGPHVRHLGDSFESLQSLARNTKPAKPKDPIAPEVAAPLIRKHKEQHYSTWPDSPLQALGNQTPREAVRTEEGRKLVETLLRNIENTELHQEPNLRFDVAILRSSLGLAPPR